MNNIFEKLLNSTPPPPVEYQAILDRNKELEADIAGLCKALDEKTRHWEEAVNRNMEIEAELVGLHKGNRGLMEEIQFLKAENKKLSDLHDEVVLDKWKNNQTRKNIICTKPFTSIDIMVNGDVYTCCPLYLKNGHSIGNIYTNNSFDAIWNSENAKKLRYSVTKGDFEYCTNYCKWLNIKDSFTVNYTPIQNRNSNDYNFSCYQDCYMAISPVNIQLSCDETCNLHCKSCRSHIKVNNHEENIKLHDFLNKIIRPGLKDCKTLMLLPSGEFFMSKPVQDFCKSFSKTEFPDLKINLVTNAQLLTKNKWNEFNNLRGMWGRINVSVDAAEKKAYEKIRTGGNWERMCDALQILSDLRKNNEIEQFKLNFVVQKDNYKQIIDFVDMAKNINADIVEFQRIQNWGTYEEKEFFDIDVMNPKNNNYLEARYMIEEICKEQKIKIIQNII